MVSNMATRPPYHCYNHIQDSISAVINVDRKEISIEVFIDFAKAFDTIDYGILFKSLENIGIALKGLKATLKIVNNKLSVMALSRH